LSARRAIVTGVGGQDGFYLAELLLERGYDVVGIVRRHDVADENLAPVRGGLELSQVDLLDQDALVSVLRANVPHEIYNLASPSFVPKSWREPVAVAEFAAVGVTSLLEAVRAVDPAIRIFQASSSEVFGESTEVPQSESTPLSPVTPYGVAKAYGQFLIGAYRRRYGLHASCGILYNHESPRRPPEFLPSKVAHAAAAISLGLEQELTLGDLDAERDWGYARDYVEAMWRMLQQDEPRDYVIATGELHSVRELTEIAFAHVGLDWREHVRVEDALKRGQVELHHLVGDPSRARRELDWHPTIGFEELVHLLVDAARSRLAEGRQGDHDFVTPPG
jgi:GDPmannose 4,6-dehydratase